MNPLAKKLLMKPGQTWLVSNAPETYLAALEPLPENVQLTFKTAKPTDGMQLFVKDLDELAEALLQVKAVLTPGTLLWIIYPKKSSGIKTDLEMMGSWDELKKHSLRPVASAAINDTWTALRFRPEHLVKKSGSSKEAIRKDNDYSAYIDPDKRQITLPPYLLEKISCYTRSIPFFKSLAWSNKKEYLVWVLGAKQEQTRINRITKMMEKLLAGKKNPSVK